MRFNIIIPCRESSRFNYNFKPFIKLDNRTFLEHCLSAFLKYDEEIINKYLVSPNPKKYF